MRNGKSWVKIAALLLFAVLITACGSQAGDEPITEIPELIHAELTVNPEKADPGQAVNIQVKVTQGEEIIDNADEVVLEIWRSGDKENSERHQANPLGEGLYELEQTFEADGLYYVTSHVTVGNLHTMPTAPIIVGDVPDSELEDTSEIPDPHGDMDHGEHGH